MVSRCGLYMSRCIVFQSSPQQLVVRSFPTPNRGGRLSCFNALSEVGSSGPRVWSEGGGLLRLRKEFGCITTNSRYTFAGSRGFCSRSTAAMEGNGVVEDRASFASSSPEERNVRGGRYCVLLTGHASDYTERIYGGYSKLFIKLLGDPQDTWDVYPVVEGIFPSDEDLEKYDGFVVTGSRHDAHADEPWILKLCALLQSIHEKKRKMLGICFGHQVVSRALGGKTGRAEVGWEVGVRKIQLTDAMFAKPYAVGLPRVIRVYEVHRDQVKEIPPGGELLGSSERTAIEMFSVGDHVLAIQGHPEFTEDVVANLIDSRLEAGVLKEKEAKEGKESMKEGPEDREIVQRMCKAFLKGAGL
ncbi:hypothetical protein R1sor_022977 [Riccia sorocarpa]|uniref:Glutamine amidotransferase domain-containing protein n=1 Tax=Riccia sorocarpa TaxID=122646 RepID=A0ABD3GQB2_9MARC